MRPAGAASDSAAQIIGGKTAPAGNATSAEPNKTEKTAGTKTESSASGKELTQEQQAQVAKLKARDREVRAHEQAHAAVGGALAGAPSYSYQTGPDGKQYAVGGEVPIRATASSGNPRQAITQLQQVARAATAPANPSGQDRAVAAQARQQIAQLQTQLAQETQAKAQEALTGTSGTDEPKGETAAKPTGLPTLPQLPEIAAPRGRTANSAPAGLAQSGATPKGIGASDANPLGQGGVSALVRGANASDQAQATGGPIEIANRGAGPVAAYQQNGGSSKPHAVIGRIVSLNA